MCKQCQTNPVYEFTNKRKLCARCFVRYFEKKVLYTLRKFGMIKQGEIIGYRKKNSMKGIVLEQILRFLAGKSGIEIVKLPRKTDKIAIDSSLDSESEEIVGSIIKGNAGKLKESLPVEGKIIKPLYLFLDEEILLYAKIKKLKFVQEKRKKNKIESFMDEFGKKHPEVKRAAVNSLLELYKK
jgi:hypothetical protein